MGLRQTDLLRGFPLSCLLTEVLDKGLPTVAGLTDEIRAPVSEGDAR